MILANEARCELDSYLQGLWDLLGHSKRRIPFATYIVGLFSSLERKTAESIAAISASGKDSVEAEHQRLLHIIGQSTWSDRSLRAYAWKYAVNQLQKNRVVDAWIFDDTGWIKKGKHSVGVQRQYTGTSGKVDNCQVGVSLCLSAGDVQLPVDFELYLPKDWIEDDLRRNAARIPEDRVFRTKPELAIDMLDKAIEDGLPIPKIVLADAGYGNGHKFRQALRCRGLHYGVGVNATTKVHVLDSSGARRGPATTVAAIAKKAKYRKVTWRNGTKGKMKSRFAFRRVAAVTESEDCGRVDPVWLVLEWPYDETEPCKYSLCSMPVTTKHKKIASLLHQRFRTEQMYRDLKQEFGLDHYEGRSYVGWHHHVTAVLVAYSFAAAQQSRLFPPRDSDTQCNSALNAAA